MSRIAAIASFAILLSQASASIEQRQDSTTTIISNGNSCPNGWGSYINNDQSRCCFGAVQSVHAGSNDFDDAYCCVGATLDIAQPSFSSCFPFCSGSTDSGNGATVLSTSKMPCSATVFMTDADYSSKVSSASASISGSSGMMPSGNANGASSTSSGGAAMMTSGPLAGALMVAGGLLLA